jgi:hypothetical protein
MRIGLLLLLLISGIIAYDSLVIGELQAAQEDKMARTDIVVLNRYVTIANVLNIDVLVKANNIKKKELEDLFRIYTTNADKYSAIFIMVWDDKHAWDEMRSSFTVERMTPQQRKAYSSHLRALYSKRNSLPILESYKYSPQPGSQMIDIDLITGKNQLEQKQLDENANPIYVGSMQYKQMPESLNVAIDPDAISDSTLIKAICQMKKEYPSVTMITVYDNKDMAKASGPFYEQPFYRRASKQKQEEQLRKHRIAIYSSSPGEERGKIMIKSERIIEIGEQECKAYSK